MTIAAKCWKIPPIAIGVVLIAVGTYLVVEQPHEDIFRRSVAMEMELVQGKTFYETTWINLNMRFKAYLFHVTNPDDIMEGELPELVERGPYVYNMAIRKEVLSVDEEADEVEYTTTRTMHFNKDMSEGSEDDVVTLINSGYVGTIGAIHSRFPSFLPKFGNEIQKLFPGMDDIFVRGKVGDFMFSGSPMVCDPVEYPEIKMICGFFSTNLPDGIERTDVDGVYKWSFFGMINGTAQGPFSVNRGVKNKTLLGETTVFKGKRKQRLWGKEECNRVRGTDAITWPPMPKKLARLFTFEPQICRTAIVDYKRDVIMHGLVGWRYELGPEAWEPELFECYCPVKRKVPICPIKGVMDLTPCKEAPLYYSEPHFLHGDPALLEFPTGLSPNEEMHANYVTIEPYSGAPLEGSKKMQINAKLFKTPIVTMLANVSEGYFPVFWVEETENATVEGLAQVIQAHRLLRLIRYLVCVPLPVGIFMIVKAIVLFDVTESDAIVTPMTTTKSPLVRTITVGEPERLVNWRPRVDF